jgi:DNA-binding CsgD family transcriptional regulator
MTQFSKETVFNRIDNSYSLSQIIGNAGFVVLLMVFVLLYPEAFEVIQYPPLIPLIIAVLGFLIFFFSWIMIRRINRSDQDAVQRLIRIDQHSTYYRNMTTLILLPAFGVQYAHLFWFAAALSIAPIFSSVFISHRLKMLSVFSPFATLVIHYLYWNIPPLLAGGQMWDGKPFQAVEFSFGIIISVLFYLSYVELGQSSRLASNFTFDDRIIDRFVKKHQLTEREKDVFVKVLQGKGSKQIGEELFISSGTVRNHLSNIFSKTGTHSRLELASQAYAAEGGV